MEYIIILDRCGRPLMPSKRARHTKKLCDKGLARIVSHEPYTVQLKYDTPGIVQPLTGGTDPGRTNIGNAVITKEGECIYADHVETRNKEIPKLMTKRKARRQASRRGERKRRKRRAKANGTLSKTIPKDGRQIAGCEKPTKVKDIINTEARFSNRVRSEKWLTPTAKHA